MDQSRIRNFCIIAHIDHGKSTLADRLLEITGTVEKRKLQAQMLDTMDLERERGITIKLQPARMAYRATDGQEYQLNLIDTPGHVDFTYEVSRSLASVEGAILLVDSTQGVQAQTIANLYLALEQDLAIIPVLNKIDLPNSDVERRAEELMRLIGCRRDEIMSASGKTGAGVPEILERIVREVRPPQGREDKPFRATIFDSKYDEYKGVIAYVRCMDGKIAKGEKLRFLATQGEGDALEVGYLKPQPVASGTLETGEIGYIVTGLKDISIVRVGDTIARASTAAETEPMPGYKEVHPMVYAGVFPKEGNEYERLRDAIMKLKLSDAALMYEPEHSTALGFGFRCGLLGMLHLEIVQERLRREHNMEVVVTTPSVAYEVTRTNGEQEVVTSPQAFPDPSHLEESREPWVTVDIVCPAEYIGHVMALVTDRLGQYKPPAYFDVTHPRLQFHMQLACVLLALPGPLQSATAGYASLNYEFTGYRPAPIVLLDILIAEKPVAAFATLIHQDEAYRRGKEVVETLKDSLPRQQFVVKLQAAIGGKIIASERLQGYRKDVLAKMSGGDYTRKSKLLQKQKAGKKRMLEQGVGSVEIPQDVFIKVLKRGDQN